MIETVIAALVTALIICVEHWFPWQMLLRRRLPRLAAYALGVGGLIAPLSGLYGYWLIHPPAQGGAYLAALWAVSGAGGLATLAAYRIDAALRRLAQLRESEERYDAAKQ